MRNKSIFLNYEVADGNNNFSFCSVGLFYYWNILRWNVARLQTGGMKYFYITQQAKHAMWGRVLASYRSNVPEKAWFDSTRPRTAYVGRDVVRNCQPTI